LNDFCKKILICGDSYSITDPGYPGLHWSKKLTVMDNLSITNLSFGGCSNALIVLQLLQGLELKPDFVILSFTNENRYELDNNINTVLTNVDSESLSVYCRERYTTNNYDIDSHKLKIINEMIFNVLSDNFEKIKNYFYISFCLSMLKLKNIPFAFSLGGFEYKQDYATLISQNYLPNLITEYKEREIKTNLWYHGTKLSPWFHVDDENVQQLFANECLEKIKKELNC
jgi:hypothetical protein